MAGRIISTLLQNTPYMRPDRGLLVWFGQGPDSYRDDDNLNTSWAIDAWPARSGMVGDGTDQGNWPLSNRVVYVEDIRWSGVSSYIYRITGYVLSSLGQGLAGVNVKLYQTIGDVYMGETTSADDGQYSFGVQDGTTQYYVVVYRDAPPVGGASVHTLVGAL